MQTIGRRIERNRNVKLTCMKLSLLMLGALFLSGCLMKRTTTDHRGLVTEEKYIIKRPVKDALNNMEVE